jgi:hypothetical protein
METKDMKPVDFYNADGTFDWASFWKQQFDRASEQVTFLGEQVKFLLEQKTADKSNSWQGLTEDEVQDILGCKRGGWVDIKKVEQILKGKNT